MWFFQGYRDPDAGTVSLGVSSACAQSIEYVYDEAGRLTGVIAPNGDAARYNYDAAGNITSIERTGSTTVSVLEFSPNAGAVGTTVTIWGTAFSTTPSQNTVQFNGTSATVSSATANKLVVTVPASATTGTIAVTSPNGSATSATSFTVTTVLGVPTISSFTPSSGPVGTAFTISGTNFHPTMAQNQVRLNLTPTQLTSATSTQIGTSVPTATASGRVSVTTPGGSATSTSDFYVLPSGVSASDLVASGRMTVNGPDQNVTISTANKIAMYLFDASQGQKVRLVVSNVSLSVRTISILSPYGVTLGQYVTQVSGGTIITPFLPVTGTYTILVGSGGSTGSLTLSLYSIGQLEVDGAVSAFNWTRSGENNAYLFPANIGQDLGLSAHITSISGGGSVYFSVLKPDGDVLLYNQALFSPGASFDLQDLPATGTYTVVLDPNGTATGSMALTLSNDVTGTITPDGSAVTFSTTRAGQNGRYTFNGTAGQLMSVYQSSSSFGSFVNYKLLKSDGTQVGSTLGLSGAQTGDFTTALPASGTYALLVTPNGVSTGAATFKLVTTTTGTVTVDSSAVTFNFASGQNARYTFSGTTGQNLGLGVNVTSLTPSNGYVSASVLKPDGSTLLSPTLIYIGGMSFDFQNLPATGTYTIVVDPNSTVSGSLALTLSTDATGSITPDGSAVTFSTTRSGQNARYTFSGTAGQLMSLYQSSLSFGSTVNYKLLKSDGTQVGSTVGLWTVQTGDFTTALPTTDTYTLLVTPNGPNTGSATVYLVSTITGAIAVDGASQNPSLAVGQNARYTFSATAGNNLGLGVVVNSISGGGTVAVAVYRPNGALVTQASFSSSGGSFDLSNLPDTGTYTIVADPNGTASCTLTLTLSSDTPNSAIATDGTQVTYSTTRSGQNGRYTFSGTSGQYVTVAWSAGSTFPSGGVIQIIKPDNTVLSSGSFFSSASSFNSATFPTTGTYKVLVTPSGPGTGSVTFSLTLH